MNFLGIDYGEKRIGLAFADELGIAMPLPAATASTKADRMDFIAAIISERKVGALIVGYPYNMDGSIGPKAKEVDAFIATLEERFKLPVYRVDERLTSEHAASLNTRKKPKSPKAHQAARKTGVLDSKAAALILQDFLDGASRF